MIISPFQTLEEWGECIDANAAPASLEDLPVIADQSPGPRQRAGRTELIALGEAQET